MFLCPNNMFSHSKSLSTRRFYSQPSGTYKVILYPHSMSSGTHTPFHPVPARPVPILAHPILQVIWYQKVLQSTSTCTVIWYPHSMSSVTHTPCHPILNSSGTNSVLVRYQCCAHSVPTSTIVWYQK
jgi:hypothetical protein